MIAVAVHSLRFAIDCVARCFVALRLLLLLPLRELIEWCTTMNEAESLITSSSKHEARLAEKPGRIRRRDDRADAAIGIT